MHVTIPLAYCDHAKFSEQHAASFLEKFGHLLTWKSNEREVIADIGCANGVITTDVLLPFCHNNIREIIGIDISSQMVQLAKERNEKPNVSFLEMDVVKTDIDDDLVEKFHHIFSFYSLHLIADQRRCAENVYKMLKPGGEVFLTCVIRSNVIQAWFDLYAQEKWSGYLKDLPKKFSNYLTCDRPQEEFERVFGEAGFAVESYVEHITHVFADREKYKRFVTDLNYVIAMIPESLKDDFMKDLVEMIFGRIGDDNEMAIEVFVGIVRKPAN